MRHFSFLLGAMALVFSVAGFPQAQPPAACAATCGSGAPARPAVPALEPGEWRFVVSGDARNCGDVVMPAIAADSARYAPSFYWHLGDLRAIYKIDEDMEADAARHGFPLTCATYERLAWPDFVDHQIAAWGNTPVYLAIGNHETIPPKNKKAFVRQFADWLDLNVIHQQRVQDGDKNPDEPRTYYHWMQGGVDFVSLDNVPDDPLQTGILSKDELDWLEGVLQRAQSSTGVKAVVVGMHEALPDSVAPQHAMCDNPQASNYKESCASGRRAYELLLALQKHKPVYVLASHSHFYIPGIFENHAPEQRLPGWIVGTAGAIRYVLPAPPPPGAMTDVYGYLVGTVTRDSEIRFAFERVYETDVPEVVREQYPRQLVPWCFAHNSLNLDPNAEESSHICLAAAMTGH